MEKFNFKKKTREQEMALAFSALGLVLLFNISVFISCIII